jgi:hypothetical protein
MAPAAMTKDFPTGSQAASMLLVNPRRSTGVDWQLSGREGARRDMRMRR